MLGVCVCVCVIWARPQIMCVIVITHTLSLPNYAPRICNSTIFHTPTHKYFIEKQTIVYIFVVLNSSHFSL